MAKDPAVLFYTSDFLTGTMLLSNEQKGMYITLLCLQHQKGILSEKDMLSVCKTYDEDVFCKFIKTDEGYYNQRMKLEHEKRSNFCKSRRDSVIKGIENKRNKANKSVRKSYVKRMEDENVNENKDINNDELLIFDTFRKKYQGTKLGNETEFKNFKKHSDWKIVLPNLITALNSQISNRDKKKQNNQFVPEWKNLKTWINQRCWEEDLEPIKQENKSINSHIPQI